MFFGRTDLRIGVSGAKFDAESDFEVRFAVAPQEPGQHSEKPIFQSENFGSQNQCFIVLVRLSTIYGQTDLKIRFGTIFS